MSFDIFLNKVTAKADLSTDDARAVFDQIFTGTVSADKLSSFLAALADKGETPDELLGAVQSMRSHMLSIKAPEGAIDIVGTGGDSRGSLNISTATALTVAACGVPVAKHGNRAVTSKSGASDVLAALGINLEPSFEVLEQCLAEAKICFLFAPRHHPAMRHVVDVRKNLKRRTIFNLLGPLTNPANVTKHVIGAYDLDWLGPMAEVLQQLGSTAAWLVHGHDGMDEITTTTETDVVELRLDGLKHFTLAPEQFGIRRAIPEALQGGDAAYNAAALRKLLNGEKGAYHDIVTLNAAAALVVAGKASHLPQGISLANAAIESGAARATLEKLVRLTNGHTA